MSTPPDRLGPALLIVGCSRRKRPTQTPVPALDLYEGGCIPQLRRRLAEHSTLRRRVRIVSAEHGLIEPDKPVLPYDRVLTAQRAIQLRPHVSAALHRLTESSGQPRALLVAAEPPYQELITAALVGRDCPDLRTVSDVRDWGAVSAILDSWGWP